MGFTRSDDAFSSGGVRCAAWLYRPDGAGPHPCVVMAHGFAGTRRAGLDAFASHFATAGVAAFVFDYRGFGDSEGRPRQLISVRGQLDDWRSAVATARATTGIDPVRVALWGTSFSGGHVLRVAAGDPAVRAVVAQVPFTDGFATLAAVRPAPWQQMRLTWAALRDGARALGGRPPSYLRVVGPPRSLAAMTTPDAEPGYRAITPTDWDDRVGARGALSLVWYRPGRAGARIRCPVLYCVADGDRINPPGPARAAATRTAGAELRRYPGGHFDPYVPPLFDRMVADETEFLVRHLA